MIVNMKSSYSFMLQQACFLLGCWTEVTSDFLYVWVAVFSFSQKNIVEFFVSESVHKIIKVMQRIFERGESPPDTIWGCLRFGNL